MSFADVQSCLKCGSRFHFDDPNRKILVCDNCFAEVTRYVTAGSTAAEVNARLKEVHGLYARPAVPSTDNRYDPCEETS